MNIVTIVCFGLAIPLTVLLGFMLAHEYRIYKVSKQVQKILDDIDD